MEITYGASTAQGNRKENQDVLVIAKDHLGPGVHVFGVLDGHGDNGKQAAELTRHELLASLKKSASQIVPASLDSWNEDQLRRAITDVFRTVDEAVMSNEKVDTYISGTTAAVVVVFEKWRRVVVANIGDSRVIYGKPGATTAALTTYVYSNYVFIIDVIG